jgi:hypothetical protein
MTHLTPMFAGSWMAKTKEREKNEKGKGWPANKATAVISAKEHGVMVRGGGIGE